MVSELLSPPPPSRPSSPSLSAAVLLPRRHGRPVVVQPPRSHLLALVLCSHRLVRWPAVRLLPQVLRAAGEHAECVGSAVVASTPAVYLCALTPCHSRPCSDVDPCHVRRHRVAVRHALPAVFGVRGVVHLPRCSAPRCGLISLRCSHRPPWPLPLIPSTRQARSSAPHFAGCCTGGYWLSPARLLRASGLDWTTCCTRS
jgi:hypothetical protein